MTTDEYYYLKDFDTITPDTEFEVKPGEWVRFSDEESVSARWMFGMRYNKRIFQPARRKIE